MNEPLPIAQTPEHPLHLLPAMANRHGLITGATGTGKTVTLQKLAESFSNIGVPGADTREIGNLCCSDRYRREHRFGIG